MNGIFFKLWKMITRSRELRVCVLCLQDRMDEMSDFNKNTIDLRWGQTLKIVGRETVFVHPLLHYWAWYDIWLSTKLNQFQSESPINAYTGQLHRVSLVGPFKLHRASVGCCETGGNRPEPAPQNPRQPKNCLYSRSPRRTQIFLSTPITKE